MVQSSKERGAALAAQLDPQLFKALGDPTRVGLLVKLIESGGSGSVGELARGAPVDLSVVSRHLGVLRDAGIVEAVRLGKEVVYSARAAQLARTLRALAEALEAAAARGG